MKVCYKCKKEKDLFEYQKDRQKKDGLRPYCKECENKICTTEAYKARRKHPKYQIIQRNFKIRSYGLTVEQYKEIFDRQQGKCAICSISQSELKKELSIDHCHYSGKIRGLLCNSCNTGLGFFKNDPNKLNNAIKYLGENV